MARPKKPKAKPPESPDDRVAIIHLKGTRAFAEWLDGLHRHSYISKAMLVRLGLAEIAKKMDYKESQPEF